MSVLEFKFEGKLERLSLEVRKIKPRNQRFLLKQIGRKLVSLNAKRIREQVNLDGSKFEERRSKKGKKKVLQKILRRSHIKFDIDDHSVRVISKTPFALEHHKGLKKKVKAFSAIEMQRNTKAIRSLESPATREQAKALIEEVGFGKGGKVVGEGKKGKKLRRKWTVPLIRRTFTIGQAGAILRSHRKRHGEDPKKEWYVEYPERHVLGLRKSDEKELFQELERLINKYKEF